MEFLTDFLIAATRLFFRSYKKMDEEFMKSFVMSYLKDRDVFIHVAAEHGSPLYLLDEKKLRHRVRCFKEVFQKHLGPVNVFYAMKSNNMAEILRIMVQEAIGLDVSSAIELKEAIKAGSSRIFFTGPGKTEEELRIAADHADHVTVLMDSFDELERLKRITQLSRKNIRSGVRLSTDSCGLWRKFGIPLSSLTQFLQIAQDSPYIRVEGIQFHTSWNLSPDAQISFITKLGSLLHDMPNNMISKIKFLDIGGGFWPEQGEWLRMSGTPLGKLRDFLSPSRPDTKSRFYLPSKPIDVFAKKISDALKTSILEIHPCRICLEPGRWLCHEAMHLLLTVIDKKASDLVVTDAGTNAIGWERFEHDYFPVINLTHPGIKEQPCYILGSLCTPHDVWGYSYYGTSIHPGDILLIPSQGAYTYSLRQNFIKPLPKIAILYQ